MDRFEISKMKLWKVFRIFQNQLYVSLGIVGFDIQIDSPFKDDEICFAFLGLRKEGSFSWILSQVLFFQINLFYCADRKFWKYRSIHLNGFRFPANGEIPKRRVERKSFQFTPEQLSQIVAKAAKNRKNKQSNAERYLSISSKLSRNSVNPSNHSASGIAAQNERAKI